MISLALLAAATFNATALAQTSATLNALGPHAFGSPRNRAAAQFVGAKLEDAGLAQTTIEDFVFEGSSGTNVISSLPGRSDRLLLIATHHDTRKDGQDVSARSRSLSLLIEVARQAVQLQRAKTWIIASFDGGESKGEGLAYYLDSLGKSREMVDGVVLLDASPIEESETAPSLIAPACPQDGNTEDRGIASRDLIEAAVGGIPLALDLFFDDPGISLLTQPFIRTFKTRCDPMQARALGGRLGVIIMGDTSYSRRFLSGKQLPASGHSAVRDEGAVRLGKVAVAAIQGIDNSVPASPQSDSWLVVGRTILPGWLIFLLGIATLVPGLFALRFAPVKLGLRAAYSALLAVTLFYEPELVLFAFALPNLVPPSSPRKYLTLAFIPFMVLICAGLLGVARGQVIGSWLSGWLWAALLGEVVFLYLLAGKGRKSTTRGKRAKR